MATGNSTYMGLAVPLFGEFVIKQGTGATDIMTIEGGDTQTGDFIVARTSTGTERFVVEDGGGAVVTLAAAADIGLKIVQASTPTASPLAIYSNDGTTNRFQVTKNSGLLPRIRTTKPTTGMVKGELFLLFHNSYPKLGVCTSFATQAIRMIRLKTKTFGRLTA